MTRPRVLAWVACLAFAIVGCNEGEFPGEIGGRCMIQDGCWEVIDPPNFSIQEECAVAGGTWMTGTCQPIQYERRCTQAPIMSNGMTVQYVYYYMHTAGFVCTGPEEIL